MKTKTLTSNKQKEYSKNNNKEKSFFDSYNENDDFYTNENDDYFYGYDKINKRQSKNSKKIRKKPKQSW